MVLTRIVASLANVYNDICMFMFLCLFYVCDFSVGKKLLAYYDSQYSIIRLTNCLWFCDSSHTIINQCCICNKYQRNILNGALAMERVKEHAISPGRSSAQSHTNYRFCSMPEKKERLRKLHHTVRLQKKEMQRLRDKLDMRSRY